MNGRHEAALDAKLIVEHFRNGREAVCCAGSVGNDFLACIGLVVYAVNEHRGRVLGGSGHNDFFGAGFEVGGSEFFGEEEACGFHNHISVNFVPLEVGGIFFRGDADFFAVYDEEVAFNLDIAVESAVYGVVLEHVRQIVGVEEVVDANDLDVISKVFYCCAENHAADTAETVNAYFDCHFYSF